jgi:cysteine desulfurase
MKNNMHAPPASRKLRTVYRPIYLDGFSTTPLAPEARDAMLAAFEMSGNPSSQHLAGQRAANLLEEARRRVGALIGATASEIVFTSGATEANNLAILGAARAVRAGGSARSKIIVSAIEHKAVLEPARALRAERFEIEFAPVDCFGRIDLAALESLVDDRTILVSIMMANNETGVIQPVAQAARIAGRAGALFHCDAAQAVGKIVVDVESIGADYLSISAHKMYGPMGIGALYIAARAPRPLPLAYGGGQERGIRSGTEPVALIAGFAAAADSAAERLGDDGPRARVRADALLEGLFKRQLRFSRITGEHEVVPGTAAIRIEGVDADDLCLRLARDVQISTGSACSSGQLRRSHVLEAMGFSEIEAREVVRLFCGRFTTDEELERAAERIVHASR